MLSIETALALVRAHAMPLEPRRAPLVDAAGLVLAEDIVSEVDSPPYDKSMMDGYAVRSGDSESLRRVVEEIAAGAVPRLAITPGTASRIMTGAPLPEGADAVVPIEQTEMVGADKVRLTHAEITPGRHILRLGTALRAGDLVLRSGAVLRPIEIGILAEIGYPIVTAIPRPRVAILATGNELVAVGERPDPGQIRNSNGPMLMAAATQAGADGEELGIARDNVDELRAWIERGLAADILLLSGGVSAGKFDLVPQVLAELGVEPVFHKIALRPGKPLWFGAKRYSERRVLVFGLPGNPMSSFVCFELFVRPALAALAGRGFACGEIVVAELSHEYDHAGGRAACLPARISALDQTRQTGGALAVEILPWQGSADMAAVAQANGLARLPVEKRRFLAGERVEVLRI